MKDTDPTVSNPEFYRTLWENEDVRVLEYRDSKLEFFPKTFLSDKLAVNLVRHTESTSKKLSISR